MARQICHSNLTGRIQLTRKKKKKAGIYANQNADVRRFIDRSQFAKSAETERATKLSLRFVAEC